MTADKRLLDRLDEVEKGMTREQVVAILESNYFALASLPDILICDTFPYREDIDNPIYVDNHQYIHIWYRRGVFDTVSSGHNTRCMLIDIHH